MDHLDDGRQNRMSIRERAARFPREQHESRPQSFATIVSAMVDELLHERESAPKLIVENALGFCQFRRDGSIHRRQSTPAFANADRRL